MWWRWQGWWRRRRRQRMQRRQRRRQRRQRRRRRRRRRDVTAHPAVEVHRTRGLALGRHEITVLTGAAVIQRVPVDEASVPRRARRAGAQRWYATAAPKLGKTVGVALATGQSARGQAGVRFGVASLVPHLGEAPLVLRARCKAGGGGATARGLRRQWRRRSRYGRWERRRRRWGAWWRRRRRGWRGW